ISLFLMESHLLKQHADTMRIRVLCAQSDEEELYTEVGEVSELHGVRVIEPLEARRIIESKMRIGKTLLDFVAELFYRATSGGRKFAPKKTGDPAAEIPQAASEGETEPASRFRRTHCADTVSARDEDKIRIATIIGNSAGHSQLADLFIRGD